MSPDVLAALVTGCFALMAIAFTAVLPKLLAQGRDIAEVKYQVKNSHGTNLRDDLDALRYELRGGFHAIHARLHKLEDRDDDRQDRERLAERAAQDDRWRAGDG